VREPQSFKNGISLIFNLFFAEKIYPLALKLRRDLAGVKDPLVKKNDRFLPSHSGRKSSTCIHQCRSVKPRKGIFFHRVENVRFKPSFQCCSCLERVVYAKIGGQARRKRELVFPLKYFRKSYPSCMNM
jgi:hypothetical protein